MVKFNEKITEIESKENLSTVVKLLKRINKRVKS